MMLIQHRLSGNAYAVIGIIENAFSIVWTERYQDYGEAEIVLPLGYDIALDDVITIPDRDMPVIVTGTLETEESITVYAKDVLSVLDRRIVYPTVSNSGNISTFITKMLTADNIVMTGETSSSRTLYPFRIGSLSEITATANIQRSYGGIGETLLSLGKTYNFNPKTTLGGDGLIYISATATYDTHVWGVGRYLAGYKISEDKTEYKNVAYVGGQIVGGSRVFGVVGSGSGMDRHELFVDRRDLPFEEMDYDAFVKEYGGLALVRNVILSTVTDGNESPYRVKDFSLYGLFKTNLGYDVEFNLDGIKELVSEATLSGMIADADNSVSEKAYYGSMQSGNRWAFTLETITIYIAIYDALELGLYNVDADDYSTALTVKGTEALAETDMISLIEVAVEGLNPYTDYNLGDNVTVISDSGARYQGTVKEIIESWDSNGYNATPTIDFTE